MKTKRIGFVDYDLENFHANTYLRIIREDFKKRGFEVTGCTAQKSKSGKAWAKKNGVPYFAKMDDLNNNADYFAVLAPGNPEVHLKLCEQVLPYGKTTYVDKTFAPDLKTAERIFALADRYKTKVQTSSALRYTDVQKYVEESGGASKIRHMVAWGGGRSFGEYAIHPVELTVSSMGAKAESLMRRGSGKQSQLLVNFSNGRTAVINVYVNANTPFAASVTTQNETRHIPVDGSKIFVDMAEAILNFFESGKPNIKRDESLMIRKILDKAADKRALNSFIKL